jgi:hypothetical protein
LYVIEGGFKCRLSRQCFPVEGSVSLHIAGIGPDTKDCEVSESFIMVARKSAQFSTVSKRTPLRRIWRCACYSPVEFEAVNPSTRCEMQAPNPLKVKSRLTTDDVGMIFMTLTVTGRHVFSFTVGADGLFNRMGTGALQIVEEPELCCGTVTSELFHRITRSLTIELLRWRGTHVLPIQKGRRCEFFMAILFKGGQEWTTRWQYGSESEGPPPELCSFMRRAIDLTDPRPDRRKQTVPANNVERRSESEITVAISHG